MAKTWLMRRAVRRPVAGSTTARISSSVCRAPFISASTLPKRAIATAASAAAWLCSVATISNGERSICAGFGGAADFRLGTDEDRLDQPLARRFDGADERSARRRDGRPPCATASSRASFRSTGDSGALFVNFAALVADAAARDLLRGRARPRRFRSRSVRPADWRRGSRGRRADLRRSCDLTETTRVMTSPGPAAPSIVSDWRTSRFPRREIVRRATPRSARRPAVLRPRCLKGVGRHQGSMRWPSKDRAPPPRRPAPIEILAGLIACASRTRARRSQIVSKVGRSSSDAGHGLNSARVVKESGRVDEFRLASRRGVNGRLREVKAAVWGRILAAARAGLDAGNSI